MVLLAVNFDNLHQILQSLYVDMMPLCSQMTGVAKGLAGLGALFYVAYRVWQSLARAEPIDVFPLLRPFALGLCIMFFPTLVLGTLNSVMSPIVTGTHRILETQTFDMNEYRKQKDKLEFEAMKRNPETAYLVDKESFDNKLDELGALDAIEACVQQRACTHTGTDATEGHRAVVRSQLHPRRVECGLYHLPHYRHHRIFHHSDSGQLDNPGRRRCR